MLSGSIVLYDVPAATKIVSLEPPKTTWSRKEAGRKIHEAIKKGLKPNKKAVTSTGTLVDIVGFIEIPKNGFTFTYVEPHIIKAKNKWGHIIHYRIDELTPINTQTGELSC